MIAVGGQAFADDAVKSLIGKAIQGQFDVIVSGEKLTTPAIVVDGTSYLPARSFAETLGYKVLFDPEGGIQLEKSTEKTQAQIDVEIENERLRKETWTRGERIRINSNLKLYQDSYDQQQESINNNIENLKQFGYSMQEIEESGALDLGSQKLAEIQSEIDKLQAELDALETQ